jgi:hypothetical protein
MFVHGVASLFIRRGRLSGPKSSLL